MVRPRAAAAVLVGALITLALVVLDSWAGYQLVLAGVSRFGSVVSALFRGPIGQVPWPFGGGDPPIARYFAFAAGVLLTSVVSAIVALIGARSASPGRGGGAVFLTTWLGVILGAIVGKAAVLLISQSVIYPDGIPEGPAAVNYYVGGITQVVYWGLVVGWVPGLLASVTAIIANAKARSALRDEEASLDADGWPQYAAPAGQQPSRPPDPGFTYPTSGDFQEEVDPPYGSRNAYDAGAPQPSDQRGTAPSGEQHRGSQQQTAAYPTTGEPDDTQATQQVRPPPPH